MYRVIITNLLGSSNLKRCAVKRVKSLHSVVMVLSDITSAVKAEMLILDDLRIFCKARFKFACAVRNGDVVDKLYIEYRLTLRWTILVNEKTNKTFSNKNKWRLHPALRSKI
jgi:TFIIF-interacting CTD phosphatase-like protein